MNSVRTLVAALYAVYRPPALQRAYIDTGQCAGRSGGSVSFGCSASGNLQRKTDFSAGGNAYSYGGNGCGPHGASGVVMPLGNTVTYACDATNGNVIDGYALTATFDTENRPRTIARSESGSDGDGGTDLILKS